jgi:putative flavoprotein involved in K+ transport
MNDLSRHRPDKTHYAVIVVGGGQAGLAISYCLKQRGIDHLIFEKQRLAHAWRAQRWDSFCLVTPNWQCQLPGFPYPGNDPHGFMKKDEIVKYVEDYAASFGPPLTEGVTVTRLGRQDSGVFDISTSLGDYTADQVVVAAGGYHTPTVPRMAERLSEDVLQLPSTDYKDPQSLPEGGVLVVGSGQSGCQIAEDLHLAGRQVHLCLGGAPRSPRKYRGKDVVDWLHQMGYYDMPIHEHPLRERVRAKANHYLTGRDGGREIDLRKFAAEGMRLYGRLQNVSGNRMEFRADLKQNLDQADAVAESIKTTIDNFIDKRQIAAPTEARYRPVWQPEQEPVALDYREAGIGTIIWCIGYRSDFGWIDIPVFDGKGYPGHQRGVTGIKGLYFLGLPWLYTWGSGRFSGIAKDADHVAECIEARFGTSHPLARQVLNELALGS